MGKTKDEKQKLHEEFEIKFYCSKLYSVLLTIYFIFFVCGVIGFFPRYTLFIVIPVIVWQFYLLGNVNRYISEAIKKSIESS